MHFKKHAKLHIMFGMWNFLGLRLWVICEERCSFVCEDFPKEKQQLEKLQQPLIRSKISNFLTQFFVVTS